MIDDAPDLRTMMARLLKCEGYQVLAADSGEQALEVLAAHPVPDLIISDVMMPRMDGIDLLRAIRANERLARVPVVLLSAIDDPRVIAAGLMEGASAYWVKCDMSPTQMLDQIAKFIEMGAVTIHPPMGLDPTERRQHADPDPV